MRRIPYTKSLYSEIPFNDWRYIKDNLLKRAEIETYSAKESPI
jgi:hypothetical protein